MPSTPTTPGTPTTPTTPGSARKADNVWRSVFNPGSNSATKSIGAEYFDKPLPNTPTVYDWYIHTHTQHTLIIILDATFLISYFVCMYVIISWLFYAMLCVFVSIFFVVGCFVINMRIVLLIIIDSCCYLKELYMVLMRSNSH